jgi:hypothetical protein
MLMTLARRAELKTQLCEWHAARSAKPRLRIRIASSVAGDGSLRRVTLPVCRAERPERGAVFHFVGPHGETDCLVWTCGPGDGRDRIVRAWSRFCLHHIRRIDMLLGCSAMVPPAPALPAINGGRGTPGTTGPQGRMAAAPDGACPRSGNTQ